MSAIEVREFSPERTGEWQEFVRTSNNGTLFHDLEFLRYHAVDRFNTRHLLFRQDGELIALLPAAVVTEPTGRRLLKSPYGASMGGLVLPLEMKTVTVLELVQTVKNYAVQAGLDAIEFTCVPIWYMRVPNDAQGFALMASGFQLVNRWLLYIIPLFQLAGQPATVLLSDSKRRDVRQNLNKGVQPREVGLEKLDEFYDMLVESKAKQQATPTHTKEQLRDLMQRLPRRVRLFLCSHAGREIAGVLVFMLTEKVATTFYICHNDQFSSFCGPTVLVAHVMEKMAAEGLQYLSLGPTSFDDLSVHTGLAFFKEGMGGRAFCRDRWLWKRPT